VVAVAPAMFVQFAPLDLQRCHWGCSVGVGVPDHVPSCADRVRSAMLEPVIVGGMMFAGGAPIAAGLDAADSAESPSAFVA